LLARRAVQRLAGSSFAILLAKGERNSEPFAILLAKGER
jgi:hypothetical protein